MDLFPTTVGQGGEKPVLPPQASQLRIQSLAPASMSHLSSTQYSISCWSLPWSFIISLAVRLKFSGCAGPIVGVMSSPLLKHPKGLEFTADRTEMEVTEIILENVSRLSCRVTVVG
jgi:hypothetical protein